jgi:aminopeptidase-like protein
MITVLRNVEYIRVTVPVPNWIIKADVYDTEGNKVADFGVDGTDVNSWWNSQSEEFQLDTLSVFINFIKDEVVP